jgi:hypothetical protein
MKVTDVTTMQEYDRLCQAKHPQKIPDWFNKDFRRKVGDCLYNYSQSKEPKMQLGIHTEINKVRDLSGEHALLSKNFYYFGDKPADLPDSLKAIIHNTQGHKSTSNDPYAESFKRWIENSKFKKNYLYGQPQLKSKFDLDPEFGKKCARLDFQEDEADESC